MALLDYKCPSCGQVIQFSSKKQKMTCDYCGSLYEVKDLQYMDKVLSKEQVSGDWGKYQSNEWREGEQQGMTVYFCKSCGGEIAGDETLGSTSCTFCGSQVVVISKFSGNLRPDLVIPFMLDKDDALEALKKHYLNKRLLPKKFRDKNHLNEVIGVYVPFWLYNADANSNIEYSGQRVRSWSDKHYHYTETKTYNIIRQGHAVFVRVPADGSKAMDDTLMESIEPYSMKDAVDFQTAYLAGFFANKYDVDSVNGAVRANNRIKNSMVAESSKTVRGFSSVRRTSTDIGLKNCSIHYALLPVWLLSTKWRNRNFLFAMNGQTGKIVGDLPMDKKEYFKWFAIIFGGAAAALLLITQTVILLI